MNINERRKTVITQELKHIEIITRDIIKDFLNFNIDAKQLYFILDNLIALQKSFINKTTINLSNVIQFKDLKGGKSYE